MSKTKQPKATILTNTRWKRIQTKVVSPQVSTRQEIYEENYRRQEARVICEKIKRYESLGIQARVDRAAKLERKRQHEALLDAQILENQRKDKREALEKAYHLIFQRNVCVKNFHRALNVVEVKHENKKLHQLKKEKDEAKRKQEEDFNKVMINDRLEAEAKEQEKARKRLLAKKAHVQALHEQTKSKEQWREMQKQKMKKQEKDKVKQLEEEYAQELKIQAEKASESKSKFLKGLREQLAAQKQQEELNERRLKAEEEHRQHCQAAKVKSQQKAKELLGRPKPHQVMSEIAAEKLAASLQQQAEKLALLDKKTEKIRADKERAKEENEKIQQQKQKQKIKSIIASNRVIILRKQEEEMQQKVHQKWSGIGETLENIQEKEEQKRREEVLKIQKANVALIVEKRARSAEPKRAERERALKAEEQEKVKRDRLRQYVKTELSKVRKEDLPTILETSLGGHGVLVDGEKSQHLSSKIYIPLPRYSTAQTRLIRLKQAHNELDKKLVSLGKIRLPKLQGPPRQPFTVKELVGDLPTELARTPPARKT